MATKERLIIESLFRIPDKDGNDVDFKLNSAQAQIDSRLTGRDIIPKARQEGVSTYFLGRNLAKCLHKRNTRAVIISHDTLSTQRLLERVDYMLENIRGPKAVIKTSNRNEISFEKTNSVIYIGTAGSRKFGRGDTITDLHCSEYAYWPNPEELLKGLFQAVPVSGEISIESTGNGIGNDYHRRCVRAAEGKSRFRLHFLSWHTFPEYSFDMSEEMEREIMDNLVDEWDEPDIVERFGLTAGQIAWRRDKLDDLDFNLSDFRQEYPSTLDECFQASGNSIFQVVKYEPTEMWKSLGNGLFALEGHPRAGYTYSLGADVGGGVGKDNSAIQVLCLDTNEQVCEYASNRVEPDAFGHKIASIGRQFNECLLSVESNNHGLVTLKELSSIYPSHKIHSAFKARKKPSRDESLMSKGVSTTKRSKPLMIGSLRKAVAKEITIHSPLTHGEMTTFIETETGELEADVGCMDDRVIALAMSYVGFNKAGLYTKPSDEQRQVKSNPFLLDNILADMHKDTGYPIAQQAAIVQ